MGLFEGLFQSIHVQGWLSKLFDHVSSPPRFGRSFTGSDPRVMVGLAPP